MGSWGHFWHGDRRLEVRACDLSPVWAVQQAILHGDPPTDVSFAEWAHSLPLEHNVVRQCRMDLLNRAGFHTAHMFDIAAHRMRDFSSATAMREACLLELHPLNVFWIPKARWQYWGAHQAVKAHFADLMRSYVPDAWLDFIGRIRVGVDQVPQLDRNFEYSYSEEDWSTRASRQAGATESDNLSLATGLWTPITEAELRAPFRSWRGDDEKGHFRHNGAVRLVESPLHIRLQWRRSPKSPTRPVGCYRLDLHALLGHGYIRQDTAPGEVRLQFVHEGNNIYIQSSASRRLRVGRFT